jgi:hypothetical protein
MGETMISFSHVSMSFGERKVLDNVSFSVNRGRRFAFWAKRSGEIGGPANPDGVSEAAGGIDSG